MTAPHLAPGQVVVGKYRVRQLLGFTGDIATYSAATAQGAEVALKLYDPAVGQRADLMGKLERVRMQVAQLPNDCIVPVLDAGYDVATGAPFVVTEYLQIPSLSKLVETGPLSAEVVAAILQAMGRALDSAHAIGLVHQSLKPTNVFVGPAPSYLVRITDFGDSVVRSATPTHEVYAQSAPWWAPEQIHPGAVVGAPADVFTTALLAFYALTGRSYWGSCQQHPPDLPGWQLEVMGPRTPASQRARDLGVGVNSAIDGVFARALSVSQPERPRSVSEIAQVLATLGGYGVYRPGAASKTLALDPGGYPPAPGPYPSGPGYAQNALQSGGYAAVAASPGQPQPVEAYDPQAPTPGLPPFPQPQQKKGSSAMLPVIIGVSAGVIIAGAAVVFLFFRPAPENPVPAASATATAVASESPAPSASAPPEPSAETPEADAGPAASAEPAAVQVTVKCQPECDRVRIDGEDVDLSKPKALELALLPGKHTIELDKAGYISKKENFNVDLGSPVEKEFRLFKAGGRAPVQPCGQFLRPCR